MSSFQSLRNARDSRLAPLLRGIGELNPTLSTQLGGAVTEHTADAGPSLTPISDREQALYAPDLEASGLEIRTSFSSGRGLYVTSDKSVKAGNTLLSVPPLVSVLSSSNLRTYCSSCFVMAPKLLRCTACKSLHYCSSQCQRADWSAHKSECAALTRLRGMWSRTYPARAKNPEDYGWVVNEGVRALGRLCWARKAARVNDQDPDWWSRVAGMESHAKKLQNHDTMKLANQVQHLRHYLSAAVPSADMDVLHPADMTDFGFTRAGELLDLCSAFMVNSFTLSAPDLTPLGVSTSPFFALFNHSCEPNAVIVFPHGGNKGMNVVAISDIAPGEEVLTSYIDVSLPFAERQKDLQERYGFKCACTLCEKSTVPNWADPRAALIHPGCLSNGWGPIPDLGHLGEARVKCSCGEEFAVNVPLLRDVVEKGKDLLIKDESGTLERDSALVAVKGVIDDFVRFKPTVCPGFYPLQPLYRLRALLLTPPSTFGDLHIAQSSLSLALAGARLVYPPNHPTIAIILAERAKMLAVDPDSFSVSNQPSRKVIDQSGRDSKAAQLVEAVAATREAVKACELGFGSGGGKVGDEMRALLSSCENELDMLRGR